LALRPPERVSRAGFRNLCGSKNTLTQHMEQLIPINIVIGDRTYRIKIKAEDEEAVRKTVKIVNDKIIEFKTHFAGKDMQDYVAMVMVWYATLQTKQTSQQITEEDTLEKLASIEKAIDKALEG
jgi:cell division protein ZapA (FtsZ GTPase activity inhibitor)